MSIIQNYLPEASRCSPEVRDFVDALMRGRYDDLDDLLDTLRRHSTAMDVLPRPLRYTISEELPYRLDCDGRLLARVRATRAGVSQHERGRRAIYTPRDVLRRAAQTFHKIPLVLGHDGADVVGMFSDPSFDLNYVVGDLVCWDREAINRILSGEARQLSVSVDCDIDERPGEYLGVPYDARAHNVTAAHLALVKEGADGPECAVYWEQ